ncbi:MAG: DUF1801 domain-containing protein [Pyrinomonadaceae bacterium]|nr:DUF1801 domain-containing protein [Phycisphaerales bacterium]
MGVDTFMQELDHPLKESLEAVRRLILGVSPEIHEGIKWNSPSFRTADWFATINVQGGGRPPRPGEAPSLRIILHAGAKVKESATKGLTIADPEGMLKWLAKDRCLVTLGDAADVQAKGKGLAAIIREWIAQL